MSRDAEGAAFARACSYLNYRRAAKWMAYLAAVGIGVVVVLLLLVLTLFADALIYRCQLPAFRDLPADEQRAAVAGWAQHQLEVSAEKQDSEFQTPAGKDLLSRAADGDLKEEELIQLGRKMWPGRVREILRLRIGADAEEAIEGKEDEPSHGILGLVVRSHQQGHFHAPIVAWLASWNPWMWESTSEFALFSPYLVGLFLIALFLVVLRAGLSLLMHEMAARSSVEAAARMRRAVYHHTFRLGTLAIRALGPTEAVTIFTRHVEAVHDALYIRLTSFIRDLCQFGLVLAFALLVNPGLSIAFLLFALIVWMVGSQVVAHFRKKGIKATNEGSERLTLIRESLMMMRLVKSHMMERFNQSRVERQLSRYATAQIKRFRGEAFARPLLLTLAFFCTLLLLYVAGVIVIQGKLGVASIIAMTTALITLYWPVNCLLANRKVLARGREAAVQVFKFLDRPSEVGQAVGAEFLPAVEKQIEFDSVSLREPGSGRMLLNNLSLSIKAGQRIGIVGSDNLEKHALVYLIPRLLDPTSGEIRIDEHNLRWVTLDSLRDKIGLVMIHNLVFHDTVANNIGCGDALYTLPKIIEAAKMARAHQFIQKLPRGYETPIGELGHSLTLSQKYRIALARAIVRDPSVLIIEEPEELDEETKELLDDALARFLPGRTVIFLPHRVSTIRSCDRLFLIHNGKLEAAGVHKELLTHSKLYRHLYYLEFNEMAEVV